MDLCIFEVTKKPSGTQFSVLLSDGGPQTSRGPGKLSPLSSPVDRPAEAPRKKPNFGILLKVFIGW